MKNDKVLTQSEIERILEKYRKGIKTILGDGSVATCHDFVSLAITTSRQGEINCSYALLLELFGEPEKGDGYKTQAEWTIVTPYGIATIYDWKLGDGCLGKAKGTPVEQITQWSIGGKNIGVMAWVDMAIKH